MVDAYPDALPILYYRRSSGVDQPVVAAAPVAGAPPALAGYYLNDNIEYTTNAGLVSSSGTPFNEPGLNPLYFASLVETAGRPALQRRAARTY